MSSLKIFYSRLRTEEKLIFEALERKNIPYEPVNIRNVDAAGIPLEPGDVALCRCLSQTQNVALAEILESRGIRTVNPSSVMILCGDKIATAAVLQHHGIPQPEFRVAFSPEKALEMAEELGYPVVFKPAVGSWGRLLAKINDREAAEALIEHKSHMGAHHQVFFIQKYVEKGGFDLRVTMIGGEPLSAIQRWSDHWITNTARGGKALVYPLDSGLRELLYKVHDAIKGDFLAVDLFQTTDGWLVNEVNGQPEFRSSISSVTGVDIPGIMVQYVWKLAG